MRMLTGQGKTVELKTIRRRAVKTWPRDSPRSRCSCMSISSNFEIATLAGLYIRNPNIVIVRNKDFVTTCAEHMSVHFSRSTKNDARLQCSNFRKNINYDNLQNMLSLLSNLCIIVCWIFESLINYRSGVVRLFSVVKPHIAGDKPTLLLLHEIGLWFDRITDVKGTHIAIHV